MQTAAGLDLNSFDLGKVKKEIRIISGAFFANFVVNYWKHAEHIRLPFRGIERPSFEQAERYFWNLGTPRGNIFSQEQNKDMVDEDDDESWEEAESTETMEDEKHDNDINFHPCSTYETDCLLFYDGTWDSMTAEWFVKQPGEEELKVSKDATSLYPGVVLCATCQKDLVEDCEKKHDSKHEEMWLGDSKRLW